ncbi:hypothetical protein VUR80DRAFT_4670 [Thermomyces stellatus]
MDGSNNRGGRRTGGRRGPRRGSRRAETNNEVGRTDGRQGRHAAPSQPDLGGTTGSEAFQTASTAKQQPSSPGQVPLASRRFAELTAVHPNIIQTITEDMKFEYMTPVQAATLDELLPPRRSDCLVQAKTGTGKTLAFLLPALQTMITKARPADAGVSLLVITPTRELALQISAEATKLLQRVPRHRVRVAIGGTNREREERQILGGCEILVATPGRLLDHMSNEEVTYMLRGLDTLVLDEADRLLDMGFMKDLRDIVSRLPDKAATDRQGMLFSATIAPHVEGVAGLVLSPGYKFISTIPAGEANTHERVPQQLIEVPTFSSIAPAMVGCLREEAARDEACKVILFAQTAAQADFYGHVLSSLPGLPPVSVLHSRLTQARRTRITDEYRGVRRAVLVATDVVARGMDFPGVTAVIQAGLPMDKESYVHRLGRTARAEADGRGVLIVTALESWYPRCALRELNLTPRPADLSSAPDVLALAERMEDEERAKIYRAWLGYYNSFMKQLGWDKEEMVRQANVFAREGLGAAETPSIARTTAGKMGLRGVKGLVIVPDPPKNRNNGQGGAGRGGGGKRGGR